MLDHIHSVNTTGISIVMVDDKITLEYNDTILLTFTPDDHNIITDVERKGEYVRNTATVYIIDNDCKSKFA